MSISVVVIAHNEEQWIGKCLESLQNQNMRPDETVVVLHRCTDRTKDIAQTFPVRIIECDEGGGPIIARARGIEAATGDIVCCTDGDCWVDKGWVRHITAPLVDNKTISIAAGYTKIRNNLFCRFSCWMQFVAYRKLINLRSKRFAWGSNVAFRKSDYERVGGLLPFPKIHGELALNYWAEDLYLSLALQKVGKLYVALNANVYTLIPPEKASISSPIVAKQKEDERKLFAFFKI
jgi:glycosyltransferase involved in cell wall biosynthesis